MSDQARIETAIDTTIDNCEVLRGRLAKYEDADGNPRAQPSGVVLPERMTWDGLRATACNIRGEGWNACLDEVARLNSSPVSAGNDAQYPPCDYCAEPLSYHPWHGSGLINGVESCHIHACDKCRHLLPSVSAGVVDERAAFEAFVQREWPGTSTRRRDALPADHERYGEYVNAFVAHAWDSWQARAALSAPSHGERVREVVPVPLVPTDEMLNAGKSMLHKSNGRGAREKCGRIFAAMLAAAPSAGSQEQGE